jgi:cell division protease FtsH
MVTQFGMSGKIGFVDYANEKESYLGAYQGASSHAAATQEVIDQEVRRIIDEGYETAKAILTEKFEDLDRLAKGLLEYETLTGSEITRVISGEPLNRGDDRGDAPPAGGGASVTAIPKTARPRPPRAEPEPTA